MAQYEAPEGGPVRIQPLGAWDPGRTAQAHPRLCNVVIRCCGGNVSSGHLALNGFAQGPNTSVWKGGLVLLVKPALTGRQKGKPQGRRWRTLCSAKGVGYSGLAAGLMPRGELRAPSSVPNLTCSAGRNSFYESILQHGLWLLRWHRRIGRSHHHHSLPIL